jgi:hypothetical protein
MLEITWQAGIAFLSCRIEGKARRLCKKAVEEQQLLMRQKWLGAYFEREIAEGAVPKISVDWIDAKIGFGVFARRCFAKGDYLGEYTGLIRRRSRKLDRENDYCFEYAIGDKSPWVIDAQNCGNHTRFINHSSSPNLEPIAVYSRGLMHIIFIAACPIKEGDELFYEYGPYFWKKRAPPKSWTSTWTC